MNKGLLLTLVIIVSSFAIVGCGGGSSGGGSLLPKSMQPSEDQDDSIYDIRVWKPSSPYADTLYDCAIKIYDDNSACTLAELPLLGMDNPSPSTADILDRLLVSHDWMGERFEMLLERYPETMLKLFAGLTAIVIDDDIRPAFYTNHTGAIYLDPDYLWMYVSEKRIVNPKEDYRAHYADPLAFRVWSFYHSNSRYRFNYGTLEDDSTRTLTEVMIINARLLLHELAHVNDFFPRDSYSLLNRNHTVWQAQQDIAATQISTRLNAHYPLNSTTLKGLARVMYQGATPTETQRQVTASQAGEAFEEDSAADTYGYSNQYEDLAMLFETAMMKYYFDLTYQISFVTPSADGDYCKAQNDWTAINWIGDSAVKERAMFVTNAILPEVDMTLFYQDLMPPTLLSGSTWCTPNHGGLAKPQQIINPVNVDRFKHPL